MVPDRSGVCSPMESDLGLSDDQPGRRFDAGHAALPCRWTCVENPAVVWTHRLRRNTVGVFASTHSNPGLSRICRARHSKLFLYERSGLWRNEIDAFSS